MYSVTHPAISAANVRSSTGVDRLLSGAQGHRYPIIPVAILLILALASILLPIWPISCCAP